MVDHSRSQHIPQFAPDYSIGLKITIANPSVEERPSNSQVPKWIQQTFAK
jgi:hypothetical protein